MMTPHLPIPILPVNFAFFSRGHLANSVEYNIPGIIFPSNSQPRPPPPHTHLLQHMSLNLTSLFINKASTQC